jgi:REP element-mobilizing transposase RayT
MDAQAGDCLNTPMSRRDYIDFQEKTSPLAYLITIRTYGTWLHGDERGSVDRRYYNKYGTPKIPPSKQRVRTEQALLKHPPVALNQAQRVVVEQAIREVCAHRGYHLMAVNARTNHVHSVVAAECEPEPVMNAFKAYATRHLREAGLMSPGVRPWSRHGSNPYLWTPEDVERAIEYVINGQDDKPLRLKYEIGPR